MAVEITMPQLSDTMSEGRILTWLKKEGDKVSRGEALAEVATDKADLEIEAFHEGTLLKIQAEVGQTVQVGTVIALIGQPGESVAASVTATPQARPAASQAEAASAPAQAAPTTINGTSSDSERVKISPLARNIAQNQGIDYSTIQGSGEGGRIVRRDIEAKAVVGTQGAPETVKAEVRVDRPAPPAKSAELPRSMSQVETVQSVLGSGKSTEPLSRMRQTIAARMVESSNTVPHFYVTAKVRVGNLSKLRDSLKTLNQYEGLTFNHLILKATGIALRRVPRINSHYENDSLIQPQNVNIGVITAVPDGLLIPVVKNADVLSLADIVAEARAMVQRARSGRPKSDDLLGGTFSISNMGMFAVESFTAIINPGQGGILAVSSINEEPVVVDGNIQPGKVMRLTLSVDHRIIDGVVAGEFLTELTRLLEDPVLLLA